MAHFVTVIILFPFQIGIMMQPDGSKGPPGNGGAMNMQNPDFNSLGIINDANGGDWREEAYRNKVSIRHLNKLILL